MAEYEIFRGKDEYFTYCGDGITIYSTSDEDFEYLIYPRDAIGAAKAILAELEPEALRGAGVEEYEKRIADLEKRLDGACSDRQMLSALASSDVELSEKIGEVRKEFEKGLKAREDDVYTLQQILKEKETQIELLNEENARLCGELEVALARGADWKNEANNALNRCDDFLKEVASLKSSLADEKKGGAWIVDNLQGQLRNTHQALEDARETLQTFQKVIDVVRPHVVADLVEKLKGVGGVE